ncbi:MAG: hypothetical protein PHP62_05195 [Candidatus Moranbacteria bacterium]|nr:hypothetical protein [Candidatus Moranbacteria bacterium]
MMDCQNLTKINQALLLPCPHFSGCTVRELEQDEVVDEWNLATTINRREFFRDLLMSLNWSGSEVEQYCSARGVEVLAEMSFSELPTLSLKRCILWSYDQERPPFAVANLKKRLSEIGLQR